MESTLHPTAPIDRVRAAGTVLLALPVLFLTFDCAIKLAGERHAVEGTVDLGFAATAVRPIGLLEAACLALLVVPRTAPLGAVLLTGYLGGAVAIHAQLGNPLATHALFPVYLGALVWGALAMRDRRISDLVRSLVTPRRTS
jgi:hypothetical protein